MTRFLYYFISTIVIGLIIYGGLNIKFQIEETASISFNVYPVVLFDSVFAIVIGLLLRFPRLFMEIKENKRWTFDWVKLVAVALPAFCIILMSSLSFLGIIPAAKMIIMGGPTLLTIAGIVFGYVLLDCLKD